MLEKTLFRIDLPYRDPMEVRAFLFGTTSDGRLLGESDVDPDVDPDDFERSIAFVGAMRGDEVQQTYICSRLVHKMRKIEADGEMEPGRMVMIVPCVNPASMDMGRRFWVGDGTDINRMSPGYDRGETTQRIAAGIFAGVQGFKMGVHFSSFYLRGDFLDHVRVMMGPGEDTDQGELFGLPYVLHHVPGSFDTTTLHYNWRLWDTEAYSLYTHVTEHIDEGAAATMVRACLRFLDARGIIHRPCHGGMRSTTFDESCLVRVQVSRGGIFHPLVKLGDLVSSGQAMAQITDPYTGEVSETIVAPSGGLVFFACRQPLVIERTLAFQIVPRDVDATPDSRRGNFLDPEA